MNGLQLVLVIVGAIAVTAYAQQRALQPALVITVVALAASFIPGTPRLELESDVILGVVLPPLLYSAALRFSFVSFMRKLDTILVLGVGLVVITALAVGLVGAWAVPGLTFGTALVLGAIVAPPDAVSAVSIGRQLGLRRRVLSVLTGESLVNDAAALTLFSVAVASVTGSHTFIDHPVLLFLYGATVGIAAGMALAIAALWIRLALRNAALETVLGLVVPFAAYMLAEELEASGVIAVVTAGFLVGTLSVRSGYETRLQERQVWDALDVLLEAFVFAYVGLQLRFVIEDLQDAHESLWQVFGSALLILATVIAVRVLWIVLIRRQRRRTRDPLSAPERAVVAWTGMRGVVTLAAAAGIPTVLDDGSPFPGRPEIQAIAFVVAVGTLLIQGSTLPWLIRRLGLGEDPEEQAEIREAQRRTAEVAGAGAARAFERFVADPPPGIDPAFVERASERIERGRAAAAEAVEARGPAAKAIAALSQDVIAEQRAAVVAALRDGELDDEAVRDYLDQLDLQEAALAARIGSRL